MRVMNNNKTLFESFQQNLKEASVDESWCQEQAEYYFNQDCQDSGNLDEIDYVDILKAQMSEKDFINTKRKIFLSCMLRI